MIRKLMGFTPKPMTYEDRLNSASALSGYALDIFTQAGRDLEEAATQFGVLAGDADLAAGELARVAGTARRNAHDAQRKAAAIKDLIS